MASSRANFRDVDEMFGPHSDRKKDKEKTQNLGRRKTSSAPLPDSQYSEKWTEGKSKLPDLNTGSRSAIPRVGESYHKHYNVKLPITPLAGRLPDADKRPSENRSDIVFHIEDIQEEIKKYILYLEHQKSQCIEQGHASQSGTIGETGASRHPLSGIVKADAIKQTQSLKHKKELLKPVANPEWNIGSHQASVRRNKPPIPKIPCPNRNAALSSIQKKGYEQSTDIDPVNKDHLAARTAVSQFDLKPNLRGQSPKANDDIERKLSQSTGNMYPILEQIKNDLKLIKTLSDAVVSGLQRAMEHKDIRLSEHEENISNMKADIDDKETMLQQYKIELQSLIQEKDTSKRECIKLQSEIDLCREQQTANRAINMNETETCNSNHEKVMHVNEQREVEIATNNQQSDEFTEYNKNNKETQTSCSTDNLKEEQFTSSTKHYNGDRDMDTSLDLRKSYDLVGTSITRVKKLEGNLHENDQLKKDLSEVKRQLEDTKTRLSKLMGQKLTDNNPNIADLSDRNRPTKLAERYTELYDNEWTDAFEDFSHENDNETVEALLCILQECMNYCKQETAEQMKDLKANMYMSDTTDDMSGMISKQMKDCRKLAGEIAARHAFEKYDDDKKYLDWPNTRKYVAECFEICWLMCIQDPPVVIGSSLEPGDAFDKDMYKAYTSSGSKVEYVVWPALYLCNGGPLLCKGVAEGRKDKDNASS